MAAVRVGRAKAGSAPSRLNMARARAKARQCSADHGRRVCSHHMAVFCSLSEVSVNGNTVAKLNQACLCIEEAQHSQGADVCSGMRHKMV